MGSYLAMWGQGRLNLEPAFDPWAKVSGLALQGRLSTAVNEEHSSGVLAWLVEPAIMALNVWKRWCPGWEWSAIITGLFTTMLLHALLHSGLEWPSSSALLFFLIISITKQVSLKKKTRDSKYMMWITLQFRCNVICEQWPWLCFERFHFKVCFSATGTTHCCIWELNNNSKLNSGQNSLKYCLSLPFSVLAPV